MKRKDLEYLINCLLWAVEDLAENIRKDPARVLTAADVNAISDAENLIFTINENIEEN